MIKTKAFWGSSIQKKGRQRTGLEDLVARVCAHSFVTAAVFSGKWQQAKNEEGKGLLVI